MIKNLRDNLLWRFICILYISIFFNNIIFALNYNSCVYLLPRTHCRIWALLARSSREWPTNWINSKRFFALKHIPAVVAIKHSAQKKQLWAFYKQIWLRPPIIFSCKIYRFCFDVSKHTKLKPRRICLLNSQISPQL